MAACLITISGTSGSVVLNYTLNVNKESQTASIGDVIYIDSTATAVTYTTVNGDAIASSGCLTVTALPFACHEVSWETNDILVRTPPITFKFDAVLLDDEVLTLPTTSNYDRYSLDTLASNINNIGDDRIKAVAGKGVDSNRNTINFYLILQVKGTMIPWLRIKNEDTGLPRAAEYLYLKGVTAADCSPSGYTLYQTCETIPV